QLGFTRLQISNAPHPQRFEIEQMTGVLLNRPTVFPTPGKNRLWKVVKALLQPRGSTAQTLDDIRKHRWRKVGWERSIEPTLHFCTIPFGSIAAQATYLGTVFANNSRVEKLADPATPCPPPGASEASPTSSTLLRSGFFTSSM